MIIERKQLKKYSLELYVELYMLRTMVPINDVLAHSGNISHQPEVKLLGVIFNQHHRFDSHIDAVIEKTKSATHAMVKLKQQA